MQWIGVSWAKKLIWERRCGGGWKSSVLLCAYGIGLSFVTYSLYININIITLCRRIISVTLGCRFPTMKFPSHYYFSLFFMHLYKFNTSWPLLRIMIFNPTNNTAVNEYKLIKFALIILSKSYVYAITPFNLL